MSIAKGSCIGGVRGPEDLRLRSNVDPDTRCWHWKLSCWKHGTPGVTVVVDGRKFKATGRRAALLVSGVRIPAGHVAYAAECCHSDDCVNPAHARAGTQTEYMRFLSSRGKFDALSHYAHLLHRNNSRRKLTDQQRVEIALSTEPAANVAATYGVAPSLVYRIRSSSRPRGRVTSVFEWRPA